MESDKHMSHTDWVELLAEPQSISQAKSRFEAQSVQKLNVQPSGSKM